MDPLCQTNKHCILKPLIRSLAAQPNNVFDKKSDIYHQFKRNCDTPLKITYFPTEFKKILTLKAVVE